MAGEVERGHLGIRDGLTGLVGTVVEGGPDGQAGLRRGALQVAEHGLPRREGMAGPVRADRTEQAMLDRVPLRAAGGVVADRDGQAVLVAELLLELLFPDPRAGAVAAATIREDQQFTRGGERGLALVNPPASEQIDREGGGIGGQADVDRAPVLGQIVDAVGDRATERVRPEVMDVDRLGLLAPDPSGVLERADQLLLLGIDADLGQPGRA